MLYLELAKVVLEDHILSPWNGMVQKIILNPLAFVGKGVCFDTGGISLNPAKFMEDMTYDMAGSATVVGLMKNLAVRKAKINAVGVVGTCRKYARRKCSETWRYCKII
jgi:leucyl aminopeptidase